MKTMIDQLVQKISTNQPLNIDDTSRT
jgi:hypothetical protein